VLPAPVAVFRTLIADWPVLSQSLATTLVTTFEGFVAAAIGGVALALLFNQSKWLEYSLFPYAVILQVTPVIAIAPLLLIYLPQQTAVVVCAWIVGFFPVLSNTTLGLNSVDRNLAGLFNLYGASRLQTLRLLRLPAALPFILGGLRIAGGLSLIGAVVAEIAAGSAGAGSGLAYRIAETMGIPLWCQDEAGPYQAIPQPGQSWQREGKPRCQPHEYIFQARLPRGQMLQLAPLAVEGVDVVADDDHVP